MPDVVADLSGLRLIVTRPPEQAEPWCEQLRAFGADARAVPLLALEPLTDPAQVQAIKERLLDFDHYQKAIFVSRNAVCFGLEWLRDYWPQWPRGVAFLAVGDSTARQLQAEGLEVTDLAVARRGAMNSETLLQAPALQRVAGEKILIFRGLGGRGKLAEVLRQRGARVDYCELYRRVLPEGAAAALAAAFADAAVWQQRNIIVLHSGETLNHYRQALAQLAQNDGSAALVGRLQQLPLLVPGQRVAQLAQEAGFTQLLVAENATDAAMLAALSRGAAL